MEEVRGDEAHQEARKGDPIGAWCATYLSEGCGQLVARMHARGELEKLALILGRLREHVGGCLPNVNGGDVLHGHVSWNEHLDLAR